MLYLFASHMINEPDLFQNEMSAVKPGILCVRGQGVHSALYIRSSSLHRIPTYVYPCERLIQRDASFSRMCVHF